METPKATISPDLAGYLDRRATRRSSISWDGLISDWSVLQDGEQVQVYRDAEMVAAGTVDATMPDGTGVWLVQHSGRGRRLFHQCEAVRLRKV